jgi:ABC-type multidrug transport system fused ATPase/permease subunit
MKYFGSPLFVILCFAIMIIGDSVFIMGSLWLSIWVEAYDKDQVVDVGFYLGIYTAFTFGESIMYGIIELVYSVGGWRAARTIHRNFVRSVMNVSLSWFKSVPVGRVINRFSRDMAAVDNSLSSLIQYFFSCIITLLFRIGAIGSILPIFMLPASITCFLGVVVGEMYTRTAVTVKKLVSSSQSPVFTQFSDTLAGLAVIRARSEMPQVFGNMLADKLRLWCRAAEANYNCNRWVAIRVDAITALVSLCAGMIAVSKAGIISAGLVGFSLTNATGLSQTILSLVRFMNDVEVEMQSVSDYSC